MTEAIQVEFRFADVSDMPQIADLSWKLHTQDAIHFHEPTRDDYVARFAQRFARPNIDGDFYHWVAERDGRIISVMSLRVVGQMPTPGLFDGRWGYLANAYTLPEFRSQGYGKKLFDIVRHWTVKQSLAVILVWPSEQSVDFYKREGFFLLQAPLTLDLRVPDQQALTKAI